jgi:hypothetical protein
VKVLTGPRLDLRHDPLAIAIGHSLAGTDGTLASLCDLGVRSLSRQLSAAEVGLLRKGFRAEAAPGPGGSGLLGYVCRGTAAAGMESCEAPAVVAVTDHANLTWSSPLAGPNDDSVGPRFPSMTGIYEPGLVMERLRTVEGIIVLPGVVASVRDDGGLSAFEEEMVGALGVPAASSELVQVAIVAAHAGLRIAAAVIVAG